MLENLFETELLKTALLTPPKIVSQTDDLNLDFIRINCKIEADAVSTSAFAMFYMLSLLSFRESRPAGYSERTFDGSDRWTSVDMLKNLEFLNGTLHFCADYVRGRRMKTTIVIRPDGSLTIETSGRGAAAERWVSTLQGKKVLSVIQGGRA